MKISITALLCLYTLIGIRAQNILEEINLELNWGELYEHNGTEHAIYADDHFIYLTGKENTGFFSKSQFTFSKYHRGSMALEWKVGIEPFEYKGEQVSQVSVEVNNDQFHILYRVYDSSDDRRYLLRRIIDTDASVSEPVEVTSVYSDSRRAGGIDFSWLPGDDGLIVVKTPQYEDDESPRVMKIITFDSLYNEVFNAEIEFPYSYKYTSFLDPGRAANGDYYILMEKYPEQHKGEEFVRNEPNRKWLLFRLDSAGTAVDEFDLGLDEIYVTNISIRTDFKSGVTAISGFYSEEGYDQLKGPFFISVDQEDLSIKSASREPFSEEILKQYMRDSRAERGEEINKKFVFRNFIRRDDGGAVIVFEDHDVTVITTTSPYNGVKRTSTTFRYGDILVVNISPEGEIEWTAIVPKLAIDSYPDYGGYTVLVNEDKLHFLYVDHKDNYKRWEDPGRRMKNYSARRGVIAMVTMNMAGNMVYEVVGPARDDDRLLFQPKNGVQVSGNYKEAILMSSRGKEFRIGELVFTGEE